jgi:hypothetical protein
MSGMRGHEMTEYVLQDPEGYRDLPDEMILAIGRIVVIAGSVEGIAHGLIEVLGVDDARGMSFESLLERIKKRVRDVGVPGMRTMGGRKT